MSNPSLEELRRLSKSRKREANRPSNTGTNSSSKVDEVEDIWDFLLLILQLVVGVVVFCIAFIYELTSNIFNTIVSWSKRAFESISDAISDIFYFLLKVLSFLFQVAIVIGIIIFCLNLFSSSDNKSSSSSNSWCKSSSILSVTAIELNLRSEPRVSKSTEYLKLSQGDEVCVMKYDEIPGMTSPWAYVKTQNNSYGWITTRSDLVEHNQ